MSSAVKLITQEARYQLTIEYSLPLDLRDFRQALVKNGYELVAVRNLPPPPTRIGFSGEIARKKETVIFADSEAGEIGVVSRSIGEADASFAELMKLVREEIGVDLPEKAKYFQINGHYRLNTGNSPLKEIPKPENEGLIKKVGEIIGEELSSYAIRLARKDSNPNQNNWIDLAIEPDSVYGDCYHVGVVYRNPDKKRIDAFVRDLEMNVKKLIELVEA